MNSSSKIILVCICVLSLIPNLQAQDNFDNSFDLDLIEKRIDSLLNSYNAKEPGISIGVVKNNKLVLEKQFGIANMEHQIPIKSETSFHVASVSKQFTAFAILQLEDIGKLSLDDDIRKYIPEMNNFENKITIRNLLNHTSGLKDQWNLLRLSGWRLNDFIDNNQVLNILYNQTSLNFKPNEKFMYSNSGFTLLAEIVSRVSNMSFSEYTQKYIFKPLEMYNTQFVDRAGQIIINKSYSYFKEDTAFIEDIFNNTSVGATNLSTTIQDLSKWVVNFNSKKVGNNTIFEKMNAQGKLINGNSYGYANGQFINEYRGLTRIEHSGQDASYQAYVGRFPDINISLIFTNNNSEIDGGKLVRQLTDICLNKYFQPQENNPNSKNLLTKKKPMTTKERTLQNFEGYYWNDKDRYSRQIKVQNDTLQYIRNNSDKTALIPVDKYEFEMKMDEYVSVSFNSNQMNVTLNDGYKIVLEKYIPANYNSESLKDFKGTYYSQELKSYYTILVKDNILTANHTRLGYFKLKAIKNDYFIGTKGSFQEVLFFRNKLGKIVNFKVSSSRAKDVQFDKIM